MEYNAISLAFTILPNLYHTCRLASLADFWTCGHWIRWFYFSGSLSYLFKKVYIIDSYATGFFLTKQDTDSHELVCIFYMSSVFILLLISMWLRRFTKWTLGTLSVHLIFYLKWDSYIVWHYSSIFCCQIDF